MYTLLICIRTYPLDTEGRPTKEHDHHQIEQHPCRSRGWGRNWMRSRVAAYTEVGWEIVESVPCWQYMKLTRVRDGKLGVMIFAIEGHMTAADFKPTRG